MPCRSRRARRRSKTISTCSIPPCTETETTYRSTGCHGRSANRVSSSSAARHRRSSSSADKSSSFEATRSILCARARSRSRRPATVASTCTARPSAACGRLLTRRSASRPLTIPDIVAERTPSAVARSPSVSGPRNTTTERAESRAGLILAVRSCSLARRSR
jgi:hypothetical protein